MRTRADQIDDRECVWLADEAIALAGVKPGDHVAIIGVGQVDLLIELAHRGFTSVECRKPDSCPRAGDAEAALVIAPLVRSDRELMRIVSQTRRQLRSGGSLLVQLSRSMAAAFKPLQEAMLRQGFVLAGADGAATICFRKLAVGSGADRAVSAS